MLNEADDIEKRKSQNQKTDVFSQGKSGSAGATYLNRTYSDKESRYDSSIRFDSNRSIGRQGSRNERSLKMSRRQVQQLVIAVTLIMLFLVACGGNAPTAKPTITDIRTAGGPRVGDVAPDFTLPDKDGNMVRLADELKDHSSVVLVFYYEGT